MFATRTAIFDTPSATRNGTWSGLGDVDGQIAIPGAVAVVSGAQDYQLIV
jgi:hypothetical protein